MTASQSSQKKGMKDKKFNEFNALYKQFLAGMRWINRQIAKGVNVEKDKKDFLRIVADPLDAMWGMFTDGEKDYFLEIERQGKL